MLWSPSSNHPTRSGPNGSGESLGPDSSDHNPGRSTTLNEILGITAETRPTTVLVNSRETFGTRVVYMLFDLPAVVGTRSLESFMPRSRSPKSRATNVSRARRRQRAAHSGTSRQSGQGTDRSLRRRKVLRWLVARTHKFPWSANLVTTLIEELYVEDEFNAHLGDPEILPRRRYPQASHSPWHCGTWRPDDLACILRRPRIRTKLTP